MESALFHTELLTGPEPGRARRPCRAGKSVAQVQVKRRLTEDGSPYRPRVFARFMAGEQVRMEQGAADVSPLHRCGGAASLPR